MTKLAENNQQGPANIADDRVLGAVKIRSGKINFKSRKFRNALKRIKKENDKIDEAKKIDPIKMLRRFDV